MEAGAVGGLSGVLAEKRCLSLTVRVKSLKVVFFVGTRVKCLWTLAEVLLIFDLLRS